MPSLSALRSRVAALPGTARLTEALAVPSAEVVAAAPPGARPSSSPRSPRPAPARPCSPSPPPAARPRTSPPRSRRPARREPSPCSPPGRRCRTSGSARAATPSAAGSRCCAGWPTPTTSDADVRRRSSVVVAPVRAVLQPLVKGLGDLEPGRAAAPATSVPLEQVVEALAAAAYTRIDLVERRGEFAVRGGILDVFPPTEEHPLRRRVLGRHGRGDPLVQGRRPALPRGRRARPVGAAVPRAAADRRGARAGRARSPTSCPASPTCSSKLAEGIAVEGMESLAPALVDGMETPARPPARRHRASSLCDPERVRTRAHDLVATSAGVPRRRLGQRRGRQRRARSTSQSVLGTRVVLDPRRAARSTRCDLGVPVVDAHPVRRRRRAGRRPTASTTRRAVERRPPTEPTAATPPTAVADLRRLGAPTAGGSLVVTEGHGLAERVVEVLARARRARPARRRPDADLEPGVVARHHRRGRHAGSSPPGARLAVLTETDLTGSAGSGHVHQGHAPDAVAPAQPGRPAAAAARRLRRARAARRRPVRRDDAAHRRRRHPRVPRHRVRRRASAASRATGSSCPPTSSTRSPATSAARRPTLNKLGGADWAARPRAGPASRSSEIAAELIRLYSARHGHARATRSAPTPRGSASSRTPSPTSRRPTSWSPSTRSRPTWRSRSRWTGSSAATSATARPRSRCARRSRRSRTASRSRCSCRRRCWSSSTSRPSPSGTPSFPVDGARRCPGSRPTRRPRRSSPGCADGTVDVVIGTHRLLTERGRGSRTSAWSSSTRSSASASSTRSSSRRCAPTSTCSRCRATPIPRTLEMAVTGIREMSTLATPPEERHPVLTFVGAVRREADRRGDPARAAARGPGLLRPQPGDVDRAGRRPHPRARARGADRRRPRPDGRAQARAGRRRLLGEEVRRARLHHDRRDRPGHLQRQHADHRARRHARPVASCTSCAAGSAAAASGPTPTSSTRRRSRSPRPRTTGCRRSPATPTSAPACRSR